jgi:hypothetical protein
VDGATEGIRILLLALTIAKNDGNHEKLGCLL